MSEEERPKFIVGKCSKCGEDIDNVVEGYITDSKGRIFHERCYTKEEG
jgi:formylmethanofuran dehydrogenase subunit E